MSLNDKKFNITWSAKQLRKMFREGKISVRNIVQRSLVWEDMRKAALIHSMIEGYPIPPFYARRTEEKVYDFLDGKQRLTAISDYMDDAFALIGIDEITLDNGEMMDVNGLRFSQLPEEIQDRIKSYNFVIYYFDPITDEEIRTLFCKLNNGKPLSSKEKNIAYCRDIVKVSEIADHPIFKEILTAKGLESRKNIPMVMKIHMMLNNDFLENVSFESKDFNISIKEMNLSEDDKQIIKAVLDRYLEIFNAVKEREAKRVAKFICKKMGTEVHMISLMPFIKKSIEENVSVELMADWMKDIFCRFIGEDGKMDGEYFAVSPEYNAATQSGSAKTVNIVRRNDELEKAWDRFFEEDHQ